MRADHMKRQFAINGTLPSKNAEEARFIIPPFRRL